MKPPRAAPRGGCQVCGAQPDKTETPEAWDAAQEWASHGYGYEEGTLEIIACGACSRLEPTEIMHRYQARVRAGLHIGFH